MRNSEKLLQAANQAEIIIEFKILFYRYFILFCWFDRAAMLLLNTVFLL